MCTMLWMVRKFYVRNQLLVYLFTMFTGDVNLLFKKVNIDYYLLV